ncbi:MAG: hypothetical protein AB1700_13475 [Bacillota bacterium]
MSCMSRLLKPGVVGLACVFALACSLSFEARAAEHAITQVKGSVTAIVGTGLYTETEPNVGAKAVLDLEVLGQITSTWSGSLRLTGNILSPHDDVVTAGYPPPPRVTASGGLRKP